MTANEPDKPGEPVVLRNETSDLIFVNGGPAPQGYAPVAWKLGEDGSRFVVDPTVDAITVTRTISKHRPRRQEPIE